MKSEDYYRYMSDPRLLNKESLTSLEELIHNYPYVENFRILYALNLLILDDFKYQDNLHKAALYATDRKKLKHWVNYLIHQIEEEEKEEVFESRVQLIDESVSIKETSSESQEQDEQIELDEGLAQEELKEAAQSIETDLRPAVLEEEEEEEENLNLQEPIPNEEEKQNQSSRSKSDLLQMVKKRLAEIELEKQNQAHSQEENKPEEKASDYTSSLIDRFIDQQPSISRPDKSEFFDPQKEAVDSTLDDDDFFITETLAHIHVQQGNFQKAIEIYQKLILKIPEKSTYFAAQIAELSKK